ncbi:MAG: hypothetical protein K2X44_12425, partial [Magnetospirillum sp.]|nr:hypothetical protein [Magnetospirillum sp.]
AKVVHIPTNGALLPQLVEQMSRMREITDAELIVGISLDGLAATHDRIRRQPGSYEQAWATFHALRQLGGVSLKITTVLSDQNVDEILPLMDEVARHQPDFHSVILLRGNPASPTIGLPPLDRLRALGPEIFQRLAVYDYGRQGLGAQVLRNFHRYLWKVSLTTIEEKRQAIPCLAGQAHMVVMGDGGVSSCEMLPAVGNVAELSLAAIRRSAPFREQVRSIKAGECWCTHNCALLPSIFFNPANWPHLLRSSD